MSFFASPGRQSSVDKVSTLTVQTSAYGVPLQRAWGTARISPNLLWTGDFTAAEQTASGGKGGSSYVAGYTYTTSAQFGLCDNPITAILAVWENKSRNPVTGTPEFATGSLTQSPWAYLSSNHPDAALNYPGLAWVGQANGPLGATPSLPQLSYEVQTATAGAGGTPDASAVTVLQDILTDVGFPSGRLGDVSAYRAFTYAYGLFVSPVLSEQQRAADHLATHLEMTCTAAYWSEGKLKLVPRGDTAKTANGYTFTPVVAPIYGLTDDDFLPIEGEAMPIRITRKAPADQKNTLRISFKDRSLDYNANTVEAQDDAHIAQFGLRPGETRQYDAIKSVSVAQAVAWLEMQRGLYVLATYEFKLGLKYCGLEPMDIVTLTHAGLGLSAVPVRITEVDDAPNGQITIHAEDFAQGAGLAPSVPAPVANGYAADLNVAPGNAAAPVIFEPPLQLAGEPQIWLATAGGANYGGCDVWLSIDGTTYRRVGGLGGKSRYGVTTAALPAAADPDTTSTLAVDLATSGGVLLGGSSSDRDALSTLCWVGGELVSYSVASLTSAAHYNLSSLRRGAYGSANAAHASGVPFVRLDDRVFKYSYDPALTGRTIYIKLQAYNIYGNAYQDLAAISATAYTIAGVPPSNVSGYAGSTSADGTRVHTWGTLASVPGGTVCEIRYSASSGDAWAAMAVLGQAPYGAGRLEAQTPGAGTWTFEARLRNAYGVYSASGVRATVTLGAPPVGAVVGANRLYNSSRSVVGGNDDGWSTWTNAAGGIGGGAVEAGFVDSGTWHLVGGVSRYLHAVGTPAAGLVAEWSSWAQKIPVIPGQRYQAHALTGAHRCTAAVCINWLDGTDSLIQQDVVGSNVGAKPGGLLLSDWLLTGGFSTAPAGAVKGVLVVSLRDSTGADPYVFLDQCFLGDAGANQTVLSPWADGARTVTNTAQLTDGAGLGTTASWSGIVSTSGQLNAGNVGSVVADGTMGTPQLGAQATTAVLQSATTAYQGHVANAWEAVAVFDLLNEFEEGATITLTSFGMLWPQAATDVSAHITVIPGTYVGPGIGAPWGAETTVLSDFIVTKFAAAEERDYSISTTFTLAPGQNLRVVLSIYATAFTYLRHASRLEVIKK